ncbi:MAG: diaminopimelate epimerase [Campylobacteraceae bacterium 4484_4]|nr:MAG: diaminopimelate epimerase [Campylobacteraceae bacterium 4484_4]
MQVTKYNASGNDFVIFHTFLRQPRNELAKKLCDRHTGVGADGLIVLVPHHGYDFEWEFYNSDGSDAEMCGNGSRAAAHYAYTNALAGEKMKFLTLAGVIEATIEGDEAEVKLTEPKILDEVIVEEGMRWKLFDTGVPHLVTFVDDLKLFDKEKARKMREKYNANVNFAKIESEKKSIHVRTYERGVEDETQACGTGMAAAFYAAFLEGRVEAETKVYPTSRAELTLRLHENSIYFKGRVEKIFETSVSL